MSSKQQDGNEIKEAEKSTMEAKKEDEEDIYANWNPMEQMYNSPLNIGNADVATLVTGAPLDLKVYCKFPLKPGTNSCWKGSGCYAQYHKTEIPSKEQNSGNGNGYFGYGGDSGKPSSSEKQ